MAVHLIDVSEILLLLGISTNPTDDERALAVLCTQYATGAIKRYLQYDPTQASRTEYYPQQDTTPVNAERIFDTNTTEAFERRVNGSAGMDLQLKHVPVRSITSLNIDYDGRFGTRSGSFGSSTLKTQGVDFWPVFDSVDSSGNPVCSDGILKSQGLWPQNPGSVKIVYIAGYSSDELRGKDSVIDASPIWEAACEETVRRFLKAKSRAKSALAGFSGPLTSERLGDYSYTANSELMGVLIGNNDLLPETQDKLSQFVNYGLLSI